MQFLNIFFKKYFLLKIIINLKLKTPLVVITTAHCVFKFIVKLTSLATVFTVGQIEQTAKQTFHISNQKRYAHLKFA